MKKNKILNINIDAITLDELLENIKEGVLVTPNIDHLVKLQHNKALYDIYQKAEWVICDSKILNMGARFLGRPFPEVIPGSSFLPAFYNYHKDNEEIKIFLLGAREGIAATAMQNINAKCDHDIVVAAYSPSYGFEKKPDECAEIVDIINRSGANVLVVGVGAPKQEIWIDQYKDQLKYIKLFMALGATIDFEAGAIKRAPMIFQRSGMEWLYRLIKEPGRLWKRYIIDDIPFFFYLLKQKMGVYKNPFEGKV